MECYPCRKVWEISFKKVLLIPWAILGMLIGVVFLSWQKRNICDDLFLQHSGHLGNENAFLLNRYFLDIFYFSDF